MELCDQPDGAATQRMRWASFVDGNLPSTVISPTNMVKAPHSAVTTCGQPSDSAQQTNQMTTPLMILLLGSARAARERLPRRCVFCMCVCVCSACVCVCVCVRARARAAPQSWLQLGSSRDGCLEHLRSALEAALAHGRARPMATHRPLQHRCLCTQ